MYQTLTSNVFTSKYLIPGAMYNIDAADHCIRIRLYDGGNRFGYLRWVEEKFLTLQIPVAIKRRSGVGNRVYALEEGGVFYLVHKDFHGDPRTVDYDTYPAFNFLPSPVPSFFDEAASIPAAAMTPVGMAFGKPSLQPEIKKRLNISAKGRHFLYTIFDIAGRRWIELRPTAAVPGAIHADDRLSFVDFPEVLNGITVRASTSYGMALCQPMFDSWDYRNLVGWWSNIRNAYIIEAKPELCAICGEPIRTIAPEHFTINTCDDCYTQLGAGNAVDVLATAKKSVKKVEAIVS